MFTKSVCPIELRLATACDNGYPVQYLVRILTNGTDTSCQQTLVSISPGSIHDQHAWVSTDGLCKAFGSLFQEDLAPSSRWDSRDIDGLGGVVL